MDTISRNNFQFREKSTELLRSWAWVFSRPFLWQIWWASDWAAEPDLTFTTFYFLFLLFPECAGKFWKMRMHLRIFCFLQTCTHSIIVSCINQVRSSQQPEIKNKKAMWFQLNLFLTQGGKWVENLKGWSVPKILGDLWINCFHRTPLSVLLIIIKRTETLSESINLEKAHLLKEH